MTQSDIFIVIPTYNEKKTVGRIVDELCRRGFRVIVIDDGSGDSTIVEANKFGAELIVHPKNAGKGRCIREGLEYALENNCEAAITMDGDGQHSLNDIDKFIEEYKKSGADLVLGNRLHDPKKMPFIRRCTNACMSFIISLLITENVNDTQCGYRLISRKGIEKMKLNTVKYEIESEMIMEAKRRGLVMSSVNIDTIYGGETSQINPFLDTVRFIKFIITEYTRK
ncbi:MAG: glycosyltransferase family 2 protein [Candidatus Omnitrophica bacterium CG_4_9_14_0_2_um_filter_42_8]|nr:MAG: dolichyl-phosphate mannose synthase [Candidatus Omnitrophica bacterium CG22_combo_CG10-13_8_21_14_all_43_16]PJC48955.1 MAG: glycosyltransferase family 2 protein [Candidatus Omnitrophica bacterium CG_4_9_14_0_2_um_filter_42_8]